MNSAVIALAGVLMSAAGLALAQSTPSQSQPATESNPPPSDYPQSSTPPSAPADDGAATSGEDKQAQMKACVAQQQQRVAGSGMSKHDIEEYCKRQLKSAPQN